LVANRPYFGDSQEVIALSVNFWSLVSYEDAWDVERESLGQVFIVAVGWISLSEYEHS
jgi:hypothetical protein